MLPRFELEHAPVVESQARRGISGERRCSVGRVVVGEDDLDRSLVRLLGNPL